MWCRKSAWGHLQTSWIVDWRGPWHSEHHMHPSSPFICKWTFGFRQKAPVYMWEATTCTYAGLWSNKQTYPETYFLSIWKELRGINCIALLYKQPFVLDSCYRNVWSETYVTVIKHKITSLSISFLYIIRPPFLLAAGHFQQSYPWGIVGNASQWHSAQ